MRYEPLSLRAENSRTLVAALGFNTQDPAFLKRHGERVVRLFAPTS